MSNPRSNGQTFGAVPSPLLSPDLFTPGPTPSTTMLASLRLHAAYIRDTLPPLLAPETPHLPPQELYMLTTILARIATTHPITIELLRSSRIEKALRLVATQPVITSTTVEAGRWPPDSVIQANKILRRWQRELGDLRNLRVNLFASEARLYGLSAINTNKITHKSVVVRDEVIGTIWTLDRQPGAAPARRQGHLQLAVGDWWINLASLFRDNAIGHPGRGNVTWDNDRGYAIVLCCSEILLEDQKIVDAESKILDSTWDDGEQLKLKVSKGQKGAFKLMRTMSTSNEAKNVVRVFRHANWGGKYAPCGGVRYDGLYHLTSYSVHLAPLNEWTYTFTLHREDNQPSLNSVLHIPVSDQYDDWEDFLALRDTDFETEENAIDTGLSLGGVSGMGDSMERLERFVRTKTIMSGILDELEEERARTPMSRTPAPRMEDRDSGYFSLPRPLGK